MNHSMNRNEKNRKFAPLNINNVFKGKSVEPQNKSYRLPGMQNIGKVSSIRRVPAPRWVPSLKAESGAEKNTNTNPNSSTSSWPIGQSNELEDSQDKNKSTTKTTTEKTQWNNKNNKPFFLMGQEFPTLQPEGTQEFSQDASTKNKEPEKTKDSKEGGNICASTLNRIDALSISKSSKGDIAATGWAAEDDEPNFEEKLMFSDEESVNEVQNWHSDNDETNKVSEMVNREKVDQQININENKWEENVNVRYPPYNMPAMPVNMPNQYIQKQYPHGMINRGSNSPNTNMMGDPNIYTNVLTEQRNERNMQYMMAVERGRQMKFNPQNNMCPSGVIDDTNHPERMSERNRLMSNNSDTPDSLATPVESGPPGGPPLMHTIQKPHIHPHQVHQMMPTPGHNSQQPIILQPPHHSQISVPPNNNLAPTNSSMIRIHQPTGPNPYMMPVHPHHVHHPHPAIIDQMSNTQIYEQFMEFLKKQADSGISPVNPSNIPSDPTVITPQNTDNATASIAPVKHDKKPEYSEHIPHQIPHQIQQLTPSSTTEKDSNIDDQKHESYREDSSDISSKDFKKTIQQKTHDNIEQDYKKGGKPKYFKDYRPTKSSNYKDNDCSYFECEDEEKDAYKDYSLYKQHYNQDRNRRNPNYNRRYNYYPNDQSYQQQSALSQSDYYHKSNSLKLKQSKDSSKQNQSTTDSFTNSDTALNKDTKQSEQSSVKDDDSQCQYQQSKTSETSERRQPIINRDKRNQPGNNRAGYNYNTSGSGRRYDTRNYKERSNDNQQEYSMGFAVNPKERNYYQNNYKNSRYYQSNYYNYSNQPSNNNYDYQDYYYDDSYYYDSQQNYPSNKQRNPRNNDSWRNNNIKDDPNKSRPQKHDPTKPINRNIRKNDKRPPINHKDGVHDNIDNEEWETASEGGSYQSNKDKDNQKKPNNRDGKKTKSQSGCNTDMYRKNNDNDDNNGDGNKTERNRGSQATKTNVPNVNSNQGSKDQQKNTRSDQKTNSTASLNNKKDCSNNNSSTKPKTRLSDYVDGSHLSVVSVEKLPDVTEHEELSYDNNEGFQEVVSRATKKNRKLEEQKRLKEQELQKQKEVAMLKKTNNRINNYNDKSKSKRESRNDNVKSDRTDSMVNNNNYTKENVNHSSKSTQHTQMSSQSYRTWENSKVTMSIGSWDNKLADNIERNVTPKPIGTPAYSSWNQKPKYTNPSNKHLNSDKVEPSIQPSTVDPTKNKIPHTSTTESIKFDYNQVSEKSVPVVTDASTSATPASIVLKAGHDNQTPSFGDKINSVKTIWDSQREASLANSPVTTNNQQEATVDNNTVTNSSSVIIAKTNDTNSSSSNINKTTNDNSTAISIPNVCKVKPQLQDISKKDSSDIQMTQFSNNSILSNTNNNNSSSNVGRMQNTLEYPSLEPNALQQGMNNNNSEVPFTSIFPSNTQTNNSAGFLHMNYNNNAQSNANNNNNALTSQLFDSSNQMIHQHSSPDQHHTIPSKLNGFFNQSSFYPSQVPTPKISNTTPIPPVSLDFSNPLPNNHTMQQLLLTRQNSLSSLMPHNAMHLPIFQNGSQPVQAQTPLFPAGTPLLPHTNFSSQLSQGHHHLPPQTPAHHFSANYAQNLTANAIPQNFLQQQFDTARTSMSSNNHNSGSQHLGHHPHLFNTLSQFSSIDTNNDYNTNNNAANMAHTPVSQNKQINHPHTNIISSPHTPNASAGINGSTFMINHHNNYLLMKPPPQIIHTPTNFSAAPITPSMKPIFDSHFKHHNQFDQMDRFSSSLDNLGTSGNASINNKNNTVDVSINTNSNSNYPSDNNHKSHGSGQRHNLDDFGVQIDNFVSTNIDSGWLQNTSKHTNDISQIINAKFAPELSQHRSNRFSPSSQYDGMRHAGPALSVNKETVNNFYAANNNCLIFQSPQSHSNHNRMYKNFSTDSSTYNFMPSTSNNKNINLKSFDSSSGSKGATSIKSTDGNKPAIKASNNRQKDSIQNDVDDKNPSSIVNKQRSSNSANYEDKKYSWSLFDRDLSEDKLGIENCSGKRSRQDSTASLTKNLTNLSSSQNQQKYKNNLMSKLSQAQKGGSSEGNVNNLNNNSQYGYDATRFSSQTAESLRCFDSGELQRVIMRLREGPVMTDEANSTNSNPTASVAPNLSHISNESSISSTAPPRLQQNQNNSTQQIKTNPIVPLSTQNRNRQDNYSVCSSSNTNNSALSNSVSNSSPRNVTLGFVSSHNPYTRNYGGNRNSSMNTSNNNNQSYYNNNHRTNLVSPFHHHHHNLSQQYYPHGFQNGFSLNHRLMPGPSTSNNRSNMSSASTSGYYNNRNNSTTSKASNKSNSEPKTTASENASKESTGDNDNDSVINSELAQSAEPIENAQETTNALEQNSLDDTVTNDTSASSHILDQQQQQQQQHHNSSHRHCDNTNKLIIENVV